MPDVHKDSVGAPATSLRLLFVVSVVRSGSTLFYALLNRHSQIGLLCEGDLPSLQRYLWGHFRPAAWQERWEFWNRGPSRHGISTGSVPARVSDVWEAARNVYKRVALSKGATIGGEKTHWCEGTLRLAEKFPDARFIFLWRDLQGVAGGIARGALNERFYRKRGLTTRALLGNEKLRHACDALRAQGRLVHEVYYGDLVANPSESMKQVCRFLDVPFEPQMTSLKGADLSAIEGAGRQHHASLWYHTIIPDAKPDDLISPRLRRKIDRYICHWKRKHAGVWPKYPLKVPEGTRSPGLFELLLDRIIYQGLLGWDEMVKIIYGIAPLSLGRWYRDLREQRSSKPKDSFRPVDLLAQSSAFDRIKSEIEIPG